MNTSVVHWSRRRFLQLGAGLGLAPWLPWRPASAVPISEHVLTARIAKVKLGGEFFPPTEVWAYNGQVPGPVLRVRQGEPVRIRVRNQLPQETTVHWHGLRIPIAMDGVPHLSQPPIRIGEEFVYEFTPPDAGTFWYHPHVNTAEQVDRGLYGALIVEEREPPTVDRDLVWVLDDWRLDRNATIVADFYSQHDFARAGRIGNTITLNGGIPQALRVRRNERIRLRLINACNGRIMQLRFGGLRPVIVAHDGQPVKPYEAPGAAVLVAPAQRVDVMLDCTGKPGERLAVVDGYYPQQPYKLLDLVYEAEPLRDRPLDAPLELPPNPLPEPDLRDSQREDVLLEGGDLGRLHSARTLGQDAGLSELLMLGKMWAINGVASFSQHPPPMFSVKRGRTCVLKFENRSAWPHPFHLHGHHFKVLSHTSQQAMVGKWLDTVLLSPEERAEVAFVADNPGDWMFHCHILEHAEAGMMAVIRVAD